jgi:hypothetical protein
MLKITKRVVADQHDVTAATTVAAVRTALRHVCLTAEAETTVTACAGGDMDSGPVFHRDSCGPIGGVEPPCLGRSYSTLSGATEMTRPRRPVLN